MGKYNKILQNKVNIIKCSKIKATVLKNLKNRESLYQNRQTFKDNVKFVMKKPKQKLTLRIMRKFKNIIFGLFWAHMGMG